MRDTLSKRALTASYKFSVKNEKNDGEIDIRFHSQVVNKIIIFNQMQSWTNHMRDTLSKRALTASLWIICKSPEKVKLRKF